MRLLTIESIRAQYEVFHCIMLAAETSEIDIIKAIHIGSAKGFVTALREEKKLYYSDWEYITTELNKMLDKEIFCKQRKVIFES